MKESPRQFDALLLKGKLALAQKKGKTAVDAFRIVLKDSPTDSGIQSLLGQSHVLAGEFELAQESFEKAVTYNSRQLDAYKALARLSARKGNLKAAQGHLESILKVVPKHGETLWSLFKLQMSQQQWGDAQETVERLNQAGGGGYQIAYAQGLLASARKRWDVAVQAFRRAQQAQPQELAPLAALVKIDLTRNQPMRAQRYLRQVIETSPKHPFAFGLLAAVQQQLKKTSQAFSSYQKTNRSESHLGGTLEGFGLRCSGRKA